MNKKTQIAEMMKKYSPLLLAFFYVFVSPDFAFAQFEGKVSFSSYEVSANGDQKNNDNFTMYVTADRILLQGDNSYDFIGNIKTEGVLIRLDFKDFVFLTGDEKALQISKSDITSMMNMFGNDTESVEDTKVNYQKTGETQTINGYVCEKFIFEEEDERDSYAAVWMTRDLNINWGMLAEPWGEQVDGIMNETLPTGLIFREGYFPMKIEAYESGTLRMVTETEEISESSVAKAMVQIPSGVSVLSFQDYLFQRLSEQ